jgi:transposase
MQLYNDYSNGLTEGHNNKIKLIKGICMVDVNSNYSALKY